MKPLFMVTAKSSPESSQGSAGLNKELSLYGHRSFMKTKLRSGDHRRACNRYYLLDQSEWVGPQ